MKRTRILFLFLIISILCFANNNIKDIQDITFLVTENLTTNAKKKKSEYILRYIKPNFIRKDVLEPELNKGEIYIYDGNKKTVYLPLFEQMTYENLESKERDILESIDYILKKRELEQGKVQLNNGVILELKQIEKISYYFLPKEIVIYDKDIEVAKLEIKDYKINSNLKKEELLFHD